MDLAPYGSVSSARCRRRMPCAVEPGINSTGVLSGVRLVFMLVMYIEEVFHWLVIAAIVGAPWYSVGAGTVASSRLTCGDVPSARVEDIGDKRSPRARDAFL